MLLRIWRSNAQGAIEPRRCRLWPVLWLFVATSLPLHAQSDALPSPASTGNSTAQAKPESPLMTSDDSGQNPNPAMAVEPASITSWDSEGNRRQRIRLGTDFAVGDQLRLGLSLAEGFVYNTLPTASVLSETIRDAGVSSHWHPNDILKFDGMFGVSQTGGAIEDGQQISGFTTPIANVLVNLTSGDAAKVDLGFNRSIFDLSPQLVANRVVKNEFVVHPEISLPTGWRIRELAQLGPMTSPGQSNNRYNSELTLAHKLGEESELYSTYTILHYAQPSNAGYNPPDLAENFEGGWSTDLDRNDVSLSLDLGLGAGHAKQHGEAFGPWGPSGHAESYLKWTIRSGRELRASLEYSYDKSNPAVKSSSSAAWQMAVLTVSFRWGVVR